MLFLPVIWLCTAAGIYIAALRSGMAAIRWALAALCLGPLLIPLFNSHKRLNLLRVRGDKEARYNA
ncbi:hypothetical protein [Rheinheimera salexigens]|uniref:Uncharacterized protein n=1 Tax=Rheinheimera salexigens TaxID=1628148 RepID=A0A1E7Q6Z2_9GAMM|nr:hypothetical protein [Rheinheimera salexigens]OEY69939.1 hypothetical protein BI198_10460 [Rheinheimera salexigens]